MIYEQMKYLKHFCELKAQSYGPKAPALEYSAGTRCCKHAIKDMFSTRQGASAESGTVPIRNGLQHQETL